MSNKLKFHLGCGLVHLPGFVNIDLAKSPAVDQIMDIRKLDYSDNAADLIYASHVIEHFPHGEVPKVLAEWRRVVRPGGKLIIVTPNFDAHVNYYLHNTGRYLHPRHLLSGRWLKKRRPELKDDLVADITGGALFPEIDNHYESYHKTIFNPGSFEKLARLAGWNRIQPIDLKHKPFPIDQVDSSKLHYSSMAFILTK